MLFRSPQLEAYAFALENPAKGEAKKISSLGIYSWSLDRASGNLNVGFGYRVNVAWYPVERNPMALQKRLVEFVGVVNGSMPESKQSCDQCRYISERDSIVREN